MTVSTLDLKRVEGILARDIDANRWLVRRLSSEVIQHMELEESSRFAVPQRLMRFFQQLLAACPIFSLPDDVPVH